MKEWDGTSRSQLIKIIEEQDLVIDYLYDSLGPAADDIMDMAYEYAEKNLTDTA